MSRRFARPSRIDPVDWDKSLVAMLAKYGCVEAAAPASQAETAAKPAGRRLKVAKTQIAGPNHPFYSGGAQVFRPISRPCDDEGSPLIADED